jgi:hypothetical protein
MRPKKGTSHLSWAISGRGLVWYDEILVECMFKCKNIRTASYVDLFFLEN